MKIAVTGASGQLGRLVLEGLSARGSAAIGLARDPAKVAVAGVETRRADYDRPETLGPALAGVGTLLLVSGSEIGRRIPQHLAVIAAAKAAGVGRVVYTSLLKADVSPLSLAPEHRETEAALRASGLGFSILRNGWYFENHTASLPAALAQGALIGSAGAGRFASAARADYAAAAVAALTGAGHEGRTYELAGDAAFTLADLAAALSRRVGRTIPYRNLSEAEHAAALEGAGLPGWLAAALAGFDSVAPSGALLEEGRALSRLIGRPTRTLDEAVAAAFG